METEEGDWEGFEQFQDHSESPPCTNDKKIIQTGNEIKQSPEVVIEDSLKGISKESKPKTSPHKKFKPQMKLPEIREKISPSHQGERERNWDRSINESKGNKKVTMKDHRYERIPIVRRDDEIRFSGAIFYRGFMPRSSDNYFRLLKDVDFLGEQKKPMLKMGQNICFDSRFESGNLNYVFQVGETEFDLYMKVDTNTNGHRQWFYFSIKNTCITTVRLNIFRFKKKFSLFQRGMRPYIRSRKGKNEWIAGGKKVQYRTERSCNEYGIHRDKNTYYLSFEYKFQHEDDQVFFAAGIPYTYSFLKEELENLTEITKKNDKIKVKQQILCKSMCGVEIPYLTISPTKSTEPPNYLIINTRTHAGETSCSWVLQGILEKLSDSEELWSWIHSNNIWIKIVPMLNPDGVVMGNYRTGILGEDFNRKFLTGKKEFYPEIHGLKKLISECKKNGKIQLFLDLHGHSILKNSFIYGPVQDLFGQFPLKSLPYNLWHSSKYFRFSSCKFQFDRDLNETARVYFQLKESILTFTCENSLGLYHDQNQTFQFFETDYKSFGESMINSMSKLLTRQKIKVCEEKEQRAKASREYQTETSIKEIKIDTSPKQKTSFKKEKPFIKIEMKTVKESSASPRKQFPSIKKEQSKIPKIPKNSSQKEIKQQFIVKAMEKKKREREGHRSHFEVKGDKKQVNMTLQPETSDHNENMTSKLKKMLNKELIEKNMLTTTGMFPKKIQEFQFKINEQKDSKFKIRRKSEAIKFTPENLKKKISEKNEKKIASSTFINDCQEEFSFQRSTTYDPTYYNEYKTINEKCFSEENQLEIINENFSDDYQSINDEDSESDDLCEKDKNFLFDYIRNHRKMKTNQNETEEQEEEEEIREPQTALNNIKFKEIRFRSIQEHIPTDSEKVISNIKPTKREPYRFRDFTHKSLCRPPVNEQDEELIQITRVKKLNERIKQKKRESKRHLSKRSQL